MYLHKDTSIKEEELLIITKENDYIYEEGIDHGSTKCNDS